jgi:predicted nucleic acid-binding protein
LSNSSGRLVADASAIINIIATQYPIEILRALPEDVVVTDVVVDEIEEGRQKGRRDADVLDELRRDGFLEVESLGDRGKEFFEQLVFGPASATLDDGEAATIAYAAENTLGVIMDDSKARRICQRQFGGVGIRCSVEIFRHVEVQEALGRQRLELAVLNSLQLARMGVPVEHIEWVVSIIGESNASSCPSLPRRNREAAAHSKSSKRPS